VAPLVDNMMALAALCRREQRSAGQAVRNLTWQLQHALCLSLPALPALPALPTSSDGS
jgi:hypothetical protein